jgi:hypothetical protein
VSIAATQLREGGKSETLYPSVINHVVRLCLCVFRSSLEAAFLASDSPPRQRCLRRSRRTRTTCASARRDHLALLTVSSMFQCVNMVSFYCGIECRSSLTRSLSFVCSQIRQCFSVSLTSTWVTTACAWPSTECHQQKRTSISSSWTSNR